MSPESPRSTIYQSEEQIDGEWLSLGRPCDNFGYHLSKAMMIHKISKNPVRVVDLHTHQVHWSSPEDPK